MRFKDVVGQSKIQSDLINLYNSGKMPHAILLLGKEGVGGLPMALAFSQYVFCSQKSDTDSCGNCPSCQKIKKLAHPDLHLSFPSVTLKPNTKAKSSNFLNEFREFVKQNPYQSTFKWLQFINAENKQGNISADECREMIDNLNLTAYEGGMKMQIIWRPEYLGKEGNILLKLIEEPPRNTLIILVAEESESVLKTILSRTQLVQLPPLSPQEIASALESRFQTDPTKALQIANLSESSFSEALELLRFTGNDLLEPLISWFNGIFTGKGLLINSWVDDLAKIGREQQKNFLIYVQHILSHSLKMSMIEQYEPFILPEEKDFVRKLSSMNMSYEIYGSMIQAITKTIRNIERNAHSKTQLMSLSLHMHYLSKGKSLSAF